MKTMTILYVSIKCFLFSVDVLIRQKFYMIIYHQEEMARKDLAQQIIKKELKG